MHEFFAFLFAFCCLLPLCGTNIIKNPSFEDGLAHWSCHQRPGLWNIEVAPTDIVSSNPEHWSHGKRSLLIKGTPSGWGDRAVYAHQYIGGTKIWKASSKAAGIIFSWDYQLNIELEREMSGQYNPHLLLDIRYSDGRDLHVRHNLPKKASTKFTSSCIIVPMYQMVDGLMVSVVAEGDSAFTFLYVDNVSVAFAESVDETDRERCSLEIQSFPRAHLPIPYFLTSKHTRSANQSMAVTVATQLTLDRLPNLQRLVSTWQGPISAAIVVFRQGNNPRNLNDKNVVADIVKFYESSSLFQQYIDIHIVFEDPLNEKDSSLYPVNYLRNMAIKHVKTSHVYYLDVDIIPSLSAQDMQRHYFDSVKGLQQTNITDCRKCAFVTPVFTSKAEVELLPGKMTLIEELKLGRGQSRFEAFAVVSHTPVNYHKWYTADQSYRIQYRENMEPYFIVPSDAPLMNDLFVGYGRDKCAYSRELNAAGYDFYVLHGAYAVNFQEMNGQKSILQRFQGLLVRLQVFLNMDFHGNELKHRYNPQELENGEDESDDMSSQSSAYPSASDNIMTASNDDLLKKENMQKTEGNVLSSYGIKCPTELKPGQMLPGPPDDGIPRHMHHESAIIEGLAIEFYLQVMVQMESPVSMHVGHSDTKLTDSL
jgi:hypothetical protein